MNKYAAEKIASDYFNLGVQMALGNAGIIKTAGPVDKLMKALRRPGPDTTAKKIMAATAGGLGGAGLGGGLLALSREAAPMGILKEVPPPTGIADALAYLQRKLPSFSNQELASIGRELQSSGNSQYIKNLVEPSSVTPGMMSFANKRVIEKILQRADAENALLRSISNKPINPVSLPSTPLGSYAPYNAFGDLNANLQKLEGPLFKNLDEHVPSVGSGLAPFKSVSSLADRAVGGSYFPPASALPSSPNSFQQVNALLENLEKPMFTRFVGPPTPSLSQLEANALLEKLQNPLF